MISMKSLRMKMAAVAVVVVTLLLGLYAAHRFGKNREERFFSHFNSSSINGIIAYSAIGYHGSVFKIEGIEEEFVFYPVTGDINENRIFYHVAKKGDLIVKQAYSDTLKLITKDKAYLYHSRE